MTHKYNICENQEHFCISGIYLLISQAFYRQKEDERNSFRGTSATFSTSKHVNRMQVYYKCPGREQVRWRCLNQNQNQTPSHIINKRILSWQRCSLRSTYASCSCNKQKTKTVIKSFRHVTWNDHVRRIRLHHVWHYSLSLQSVIRHKKIVIHRWKKCPVQRKTNQINLLTEQFKQLCWRHVCFKILNIILRFDFPCF